ncbi:DUF3999 family protein [Flammeovirga aprica]|uniref:DUF3999 family protein n=1 Tax=Flammeovirga aprica JL-4 TaxID=694437 RepID=A0A7X9XBJ3_9BACT|nr:DUF3999 family protein [Flammeovirga aprica]NME70767.1 DUF3999 family protein [Flammeovirga aprica JL-4]
MNRYLLLLLWVSVAHMGFSQVKKYNYYKDIHGVQEEWHKIILTDDIYAKTSQHLHDIRIYGFAPNGDTLEAPYILQAKENKTIINRIAFKRINESHNDEGYFYTFETPSKAAINEINLTFRKDNFEWFVNLEGSQNQENWYTIIDDYRILSIRNNSTDYHFTDINFPKSKYKYYRLQIKSAKDPLLTKVSILESQTISGSFNTFKVDDLIYLKGKKTQSEIDVDLGKVSRVNSLKLNIDDKFDYYRPVTIQFLADSFHTEKGWKYSYKTLARGIVNSSKENVFHFDQKTVRKLKIIVDDNQNTPLNITSLTVNEIINELIIRFTKKADYRIYFNAKHPRKTNYDIHYFTKNIPDSLQELSLSKTFLIPKEKVEKDKPLFESELWIWALMAVIIIILGGFSFKMLNSKEVGL